MTALSLTKTTLPLVTLMDLIDARIVGRDTEFGADERTKRDAFEDGRGNPAAATRLSAGLLWDSRPLEERGILDDNYISDRTGDFLAAPRVAFVGRKRAGLSQPIHIWDDEGAAAL